MDKNKKIIIIVSVVVVAITLLCCAVAGGVYWLGKSAELTDDEIDIFVDEIGEALEETDDEYVDDDYYYDDELTPAPYGYEWTTCSNMESSFLMPDRWFKSEEASDDGEACFITKESYVGDELFSTGLSINMVDDVEVKTKQLPSKYAYSFIETIADAYDVEIDEVGDGVYFNGYGTSVTLSPDSYDAINVYYLALGSDDTDRVFVMWFEGPVAEWEDAWDKGETMLNNLFLETESSY